MSWLYLDFMFYFALFSLQTELSHNLQQLSEKARSTTEFIQRLKGMSDKVTVRKKDIHIHIYTNMYINIYTAYFICHLIVCSGFAQESCIEFERLVHAQCEALIQAIHDRREYLLEAIRNDKDTKIRILKVCTLPPQLLSSSCLTVFSFFSLLTGSTIELHGQIAADNGFDSVLHWGIERDWQRRLSAGMHITGY